MSTFWLPARFAAVLSICLMALPAASQDALGVVGTWELTRADDVPGDDILVFARMTFTDSRLRTTTVYLDPDDGELSANISDDSYLVSAGQLIVRAPGSTTVLDAGRTLDGLVVRDIETGVSLTMRPADPADALDPALVGSWAGDGGDHTWTFRFDPDGTSYVRRDDQDRDSLEPYTVAGAYLLIDRDAYRFTFAGSRLILTRENETIDLARTTEARPGPSSSLTP